MFSKQLSAVLAFAAGVSAFQTPSSHGVTRTSLSLNEKSKSLPFLTKPENLDGSMAGDVGFDPLGLSSIEDVGIDLYWLREAELKHARLAMMATAGIMFTELVGSFPGMPSGKSQMDVFWQVWAEKPNVVGAGLFAIAALEIIGGIAITQGRESGARKPGDYGFDPLGMGKGDRSSLELKEIKNGRLAMWAAAGMILQGCTTHQGAFENLFSS